MRWRRAVRDGATGVALLAAPVAAAAAAQLPNGLSFCAGARNLPMSQDGHPAGFEVEIARALAVKLGVELHLEWLEPHAESFEQAVLDGRCDAALGAILDPGPMAGERLLPGITLTTPYYSAGYLLLRRADAAAGVTLAQLRETRVAVESESIVAFTLRQRGHQVYVLPTAEAVIKAVSEGRAEAGYLWGPLAAWKIRDRSDVVLTSRFVPADRWDFALAVRKQRNELRHRLNAAIGDLVRNGTIPGILETYGIVSPPSR